MSESYRIRRKVKSARERGRAMANQRWKIDRERRDKEALLFAESYPNKIVRRIVVIDNETTVREAVFWTWDSRRHAASKLRNVLRYAQT